MKISCIPYTYKQTYTYMLYTKYEQTLTDCEQYVIQSKFVFSSCATFHSQNENGWCGLFYA